jgi:hypothetical protein
MMTFLSEAIQRGVSRQVLVGQKNAPQLLFVGGVAGMIGSTVLACRATLKLQEVLDDADGDIRTAKEVRENYPEKYTEENRRKDTSIIYVRSAVKVAGLYAPSVVLGAASIGMLTKSHNILNERNAALTAAYAAIDKGFREYRARVVEKYGEDEDRRLRYDTELVVDGPREGKTKPETSLRVGPGAASIYARFFDPLSVNWCKEPEYNALFIRCQQNWANDLLRARGHVFLNEVYGMLGIPHSKEGAIVGWLRGAEGDDYIDFGVFTPDGGDRIRDFVNGREGSVLLDFNVDGVIFDKIESTREAVKWQQEK